MPTPEPTDHSPSAIPMLLMLAFISSIAYYINWLVTPLVPRIVHHALYLGWIVVWGVGIALLLKKRPPCWLFTGWIILYVLGISYLVSMELFSLWVGGRMARMAQSSIAHTAFLLSGPLPLIILLCAERLLCKMRTKEEGAL